MISLVIPLRWFIGEESNRFGHLSRLGCFVLILEDMQSSVVWQYGIVHFYEPAAKGDNHDGNNSELKLRRF